MRCLLLLAGVLLALWIPDRLLPPVQVLLALLLPVMAWRPRWRVGLCLVFGFGYALLTAHAVQSSAVNTAERLLIEAHIHSLPAWSGSGWEFQARVRFEQHPEWPAQNVRLSVPQAREPPQVGETWRYLAQFQLSPDDAAARHLLRDHVSATARVLPSAINQRLRPASLSIDRLRARVAARIDALVPDPSAAALLAALAVGATGDVTVAQWRVFNATGITHLVAISGMHVTFFATLTMALARRAWRRLPWLARHLRREVFAAGVGVGMALGYALLSGFSVPAQRTVVMLAAFLVVQQCARATHPAWSVAVAMVTVLMYDPLAALSAGFWLSFLAVASIVLLAGARLQQPAALPAAVHLQWLVTIALLPVTLAIFGSFPAAGMLANAVAIPAFTLLLVPPILIATAGYLLGVTPAVWCADRLVELAALVARILWPLLTRCAEMTGAVWHATPPLTWYLVAVPAAVLALLPIAPRLRAFALAALCGTFLLRAPHPVRGDLWVEVLDVGASTAVLLRTSDHVVLYGTGEKFGSAGKSFDASVLPALRRAGAAAVDLWLPGELGRDAQAALVRAAAQLPLRRVELSGTSALPPEMQPCTARSWQWDGVDFSVLPPAQGRACQLLARAGSQVVALGSSEPAAVRLLPRSAAAAAALPMETGALVLASVSASEWQSPGWRGLRQKWAGKGVIALATAGEGGMSLRLAADGRIRRVHAPGVLPAIEAMLFSYHARPCGNLC